MLRSDIAPPLDLMTTLRARTAEAHRRLEHDLDLLREPLDRDRFLELLKRFHGFHAVWEAKVGRMLGKDGAFLAPRQRAHRLTQDLQALGLSDREIAELPLCLAAARLVRTREAAIGSLYVLEGSTLGGQIISRHLASAPWLPPEGIGYFDPYGPATGTMWRQFRGWAEMAASNENVPVIVASAVATFDVLHEWLLPVP
jgi:heme oxygenase (biliverdin-IX-beta and delta-forming)